MTQIVFVNYSRDPNGRDPNSITQAAFGPNSRDPKSTDCTLEPPLAPEYLDLIGNDSSHPCNRISITIYLKTLGHDDTGVVYMESEH